MENKQINGAHVCRFADIEILRYEIDDWDALPQERKLLVYHLSEAALWGRDIIYDQNGLCNLRLRHLFESLYKVYDGDRECQDWKGVETYLYRLWFSSGIHHHYGNEKFVPSFDRTYLENVIAKVRKTSSALLLYSDEDLFLLLDEIFLPDRSATRTVQSGDVDLVSSSAVNFYEDGLSEREVTDYYSRMSKETSASELSSPPSYGLNSRLSKGGDGELYEQTYRIGGLYSEAIVRISEHLKAALAYVDTPKQRQAILYLLDYYKTGDLDLYNKFCIEWVGDLDGQVDFINGFTEVYADPLGLKGSWEGLVHLKNEKSSRRTEIISQHADWFEQNAPIDPRFKKDEAKGISATVVTVAMLSGDSYPATPLGINLPNADWIRAQHGSKSVTIENIHKAYSHASRHSGMDEVFVPDPQVRALLARYEGETEMLHTDLHECLGHGSGKLLDGVSPDALGAYASVMEEARADLFALYYMGDDKLIELGLLPDQEAYKACYYRYLLNGLVTQLVRIDQGNSIEEAHMRNRALIARYVLEHGEPLGALSLVGDGTELVIKDYEAIRKIIGDLLSEVQRCKSLGDKQAASLLVERYAIHVEAELHRKILAKYKRLDLAPYRGFVNPVLSLNYADDGSARVCVDYSEGYAEQMLRYSREYASLPLSPIEHYEVEHPRPSAETLAIAKALRESLRTSMDGMVADSMRRKGLHYGINFGLTLEHIFSKAKSLPRSRELAEYLLSRDVRELKLIGQIIYPIEELTFARASQLASRAFSSVELRDCMAKHLLSRSPECSAWCAVWLLDEFGWYRDYKALAFSALSRVIETDVRLSWDWKVRLLDLAWQTLLEDGEYISADQGAALLFVQRFARLGSKACQTILTHPMYQSLESSEDPIKREFSHSIAFEVEYLGS